MTIKIGANTIRKIKLGNSNLRKVYLGSTLIYPNGPAPFIPDPFEASTPLVLRFNYEPGVIALPGNEGLATGTIVAHEANLPFHSTAQTLNYSTSLDASSPSNRRISITYDPDFSPGGDTTANNRPWCAEMFVYCTDRSGASIPDAQVLMTDRRVTAGNARGWYLGVTDLGALYFQAWDTAQTLIVNMVSATNLIQNGNWYHIAVQRDNARNWTLYINGVSVATATQGGAANIADDAQRVDFFGWKGDGNHLFVGHLDSVRITRDIRYTGTFTPAAFVPTDFVPGLVGAAPTGSEVAARAWRIYPMFTSGTNVQAREISFRHEIGGADDLADRGGLRFYQRNISGFEARNAFDDDSATNWAGSGGWKQWIGIDLGPDYTTVVREVTIKRSSSFPDQRYLAFLVEYSLDGVEWHPYFLHPNKITSPGTDLPNTDNTVTVTPNLPAITAPGTPRRYTELLCWGHGENETVAGVDRLFLLDSAGQDIFTLHGGTPTAAGNNGGGFVPASAFDATLNAWRHNIAGGQVSWLRLDHGAGTPRAVHGFFAYPEVAFSLGISETLIRTSDDLTNWQYLHYEVDRTSYEGYGTMFDNPMPTTPVYQNIATSPTAIASFPTGITAGNLLVLFIGSGAGGGTSSPGAGWNRVRIFYDVGTPQVEVFYKIADGTETGTFDVNPAAGADNNYTTAVLRITGASTRLPIVSANYSGRNSNGTTNALPAVKITRTGQLLITCHIVGVGGTVTTTFPSLYTSEIADFSSTTSGAGGSCMAIALKTNTKAGDQYGNPVINSPQYEALNATVSATNTFAAFSIVVEGDTP